MGPVLLVTLYIVYAALIILLRTAMVKRTKGQADGVADYLALISLAVPVLGLLGSLLVWRTACRTDETDILDYEETLRFDVLPYEEMRREAEYSKSVMPIALSIESSQQEVSRELIIRQLHLLSSGQGTYLKQAVRGSGVRPELAHYASATYHLLNNRYAKMIRTLEEQPDQDEKTQLTALYEAYHAYWRSDLLTGKEQQQLLRKQRQLLERLIELDPADPAPYEAIGNLLTASDRNSREVLVHYRKAAFRFPERLSFQEELVRNLLYQDHWKDAHQLIEKLEERDVLKKTSDAFQEVIRSLWVPRASS